MVNQSCANVFIDWNCFSGEQCGTRTSGNKLHLLDITYTFNSYNEWLTLCIFVGDLHQLSQWMWFIKKSTQSPENFEVKSIFLQFRPFKTFLCESLSIILFIDQIIRICSFCLFKGICFDFDECIIYHNMMQWKYNMLQAVLLKCGCCQIVYTLPVSKK